MNNPHSQKSREGYLLVDHQASPGLPEDIARLSGYDPALCGEGKRFEAATLTCSHCKCAVVKNPLRTRERPHCFRCNHYICDGCAALADHPDYVHTPFDKIIDRGVLLSPPHSPGENLIVLSGNPPSRILP